MAGLFRVGSSCVDKRGWYFLLVRKCVSVLATEKFTVGGARVVWGIARAVRALLVQQTRDTFRERSPRDDWTLEPRTVRVRVKFFHDPFRFCSGFLGCMYIYFFVLFDPWLFLFPATLNIGGDSWMGRGCLICEGRQ